MSGETRLPTAQNRTAICGSTGSGKTQFAVWLLSTRDFHLRPWVIIDFKHDKLIAEIGAQEIKCGSKPPKKPGLYVVRPLPGFNDEQIEQFLWDCWSQENIGIYVDEGYMLSTKKQSSLVACLTQGRSKNLEMIILSQRPVWMNRFVFSEADFFATFRLNDRRDIETVQSMTSLKLKERLPPFHCYWYDVGGDRGTVFSPCPDREKLIAIFEQRLNRKARII